MSARIVRRPLIGISTRLSIRDDTFYLKRYYSEAIYGAGGAPVEIPLIPEADYIQSLISRLDAVVLSGSNSDVDPARYGQAPHIKLGQVHPARDEVDFQLLARAEELKLPVLAICYGMQALNVYRGGTLFQDLESQVEGLIKHEQGEPYSRPSHKIDIQEGTLLAQLAGGTAARVNSHHHQAVDELGADLVPIAWAPDNVIEAIINVRGDHFMLGVQWHPEAGWERDRFSQAIFGYFVNVAAESAKYRRQ